MQNNLTFDDMRAAIRNQLDQIKASNKPEVINGAKTVCMLAQAFVNISRAEIDYAKAAGIKLGSMIDITPEAQGSTHERIEVSPGVTQHRLK